MKKHKTKHEIIKNGIVILLLVIIVALSFMSIKERGITITGAAVTKVLVFERFGYGCNITLISGWNLISLPCEQTNNSILTVLNNTLLNYTSVHYYNASDINDHWKAFNPSLPSWVSHDLNFVSTKDGYWIKSNVNFTHNINGSITVPQYVELFKGWNLIFNPI